MTTERIVFLSAYHDYRTAKRASIHPLANALAQSGYDVSFISTRFSHLSKRKGDSRLFLWDRANRIETVDGIRCYLWRTAFHPFATGSPITDKVMELLFPLYAALPNRDVDRLFAEADYVVVEASVAAILLRRIRRLNARAQIIYYATDRLDTVGAHPFVRRRLVKDAGLIEHVSLRSSLMADDFAWAGPQRLRRIGFGIEPSDFTNIGRSPYPDGVRAAVSVGSMLFDPSFFREVAPAFPDVQFHVIGCGHQFEAPANVTIHDEMPFRATLPFVQHAAVGLAPYKFAPGVEYLSESSLKLAQYEYLGLPAACPDFAAGTVSSRFGYRVGDTGSMRAAFGAALSRSGTVAPRRFPTWAEIGQRLLHPEAYADTRLNAA
ncbi:polysaccharide biosynthesis protein GumK [Novosphingobium sp. 9U]|uniref:GumK N-terminal domain-containing glycosyltransferase n=1 Tax=Novosphingobium sp. 9U TaxID=2653158 RepID=UPI0012EFEF89|nr:polysaccharide biosynthesis protein GumK [Novosphingobium sp. 9U]VWX53327.1 putative UDP-glucuronate:glycolipid 2-beta-glucuronosyltransferase [Novosphingobium sp. 9U]